MNANHTLHTSAVHALTELLPTPVPLNAVICTDRTALTSRLTGGVTASFVGALSADIALVLTDAASIAGAGGSGSPLLSLQDVLRPAFERATAVLGAGVLAESRTEDAASLFADRETAVFELSGAGNTAGWFAIRIRGQESGGALLRPSSDSVVGKLGRINDVEMTLTVEIGRTRMSVRDVLGLEPGRVIELDRSVGAPADVLLNGRLIARGEIVVVDQDYAIRITKILDVTETVS
ncbi:flagellar motor switch protein FliN [Paenarthrobacter sp. Z7-10]|uniref:flagellar motor switch protein FliN n=1 Tax=Paenarthrobacter sp. Z7-10 TaxID=2787635 RepID=UPI0022A9CA00|nr:flagellar motor switch protein FliN [Paenarthrobacter sp. Z7-10]MCZ2403307.1 flagellar motor switch protein FliN [Paenarthrobacter sp. Z7-10]